MFYCLRVFFRNLDMKNTITKHDFEIHHTMYYTIQFLCLLFSQKKFKFIQCCYRVKKSSVKLLILLMLKLFSPKNRVFMCVLCTILKSILKMKQTLAVFLPGVLIFLFMSVHPCKCINQDCDILSFYFSNKYLLLFSFLCYFFFLNRI